MATSNGTDSVSTGGNVDNPCTKCICGCKPDANAEVYLTCCFRVVCSELCLQKLKEQPELQKCQTCQREIIADRLSKISLKTMFRKKRIYTLEDVDLKCENCIRNFSAVANCTKCPSLLCDECLEMHPVMRLTKNHTIAISKDMVALKQAELATLQNKASKCPVKGHQEKPLVYYCANCEVAFCDICTPSHIEHTIYNIETDTEEAYSKTEVARNFIKKLDDCKAELRKKEYELNKLEWPNLQDSIVDKYARLFIVLEEDMKRSIKEAKTNVEEQICRIKKKLFRAEMLQNFACSIEKATSTLKHNGDEISCVNFLRYYQQDLDLLTKLDQTYTKEFDVIIEKRMHLELSHDNARTLDSLFTVLNFPKNFAEVSYKPSKKDFSNVPETQSQNVETNASLSERETAATQKAAAVVGATEIPSTRASPTGDTIKASPTGSPAQQAEGSPKTPPGFSENSPINESIDDADYSEEDTADGENGKETIATPKQFHWKKRRRMQGQSGTEVVLEPRSDLEGMPILTPNPPVVLTHVAVNTNGTRGTNGSPKSDEVTLKPPRTLLEANTSRLDTSAERGKKNKEHTYPEDMGGDESPAYDSLRPSPHACPLKRISRSDTPSPPWAANAIIPGSPQMPVLKDHRCEVDEEPMDWKAGAVNSQNENDGAGTDQFPLNGSFDGYSSQEDGIGDAQQDSSSGHPNFEASENTSRRGQATVAMEAPLLSTLEEPPKLSDYPVQKFKIKITERDENEDDCCICGVGGEEPILCCDFCPKSFHLKCHIPVIKASELPGEDEKWHCNYDTSKETIEAEISKHAGAEDLGSEKGLVEANKKDFPLACKFLMECYKIPEIPTIRWVFPHEYMVRNLVPHIDHLEKKYDKVTFHLKYIREKLCLGIPSHFSNLEDMLGAFKEMFMQAFLYYDTTNEYRPQAVKCFEKFLVLVQDYYPQHKDIFLGILTE